MLDGGVYQVALGPSAAARASAACYFAAKPVFIF